MGEQLPPSESGRVAQLLGVCGTGHGDRRRHQAEGCLSLGDRGQPGLQGALTLKTRHAPTITVSMNLLVSLDFTSVHVKTNEERVKVQDVLSG